ncbi:hypothetical protein GH714_043943 [Hevea brasiliensis]|uniref:Uncharacterized protein n=1 Tax=Hevea brasiliensis TaxID=3981 RepID=A0A6A6K0H9_HEVBR|nr:hypothetical protein GH714_043943 [Hevea brasiliensis]
MGAGSTSTNLGRSKQSSHEASVVVVSRVWKLSSKPDVHPLVTQPLVGAQTEMIVILPQRGGFSPVFIDFLLMLNDFMTRKQHSKYQSLCCCLHSVRRCLKESGKSIRIEWFSLLKIFHQPEISFKLMKEGRKSSAQGKGSAPPGRSYLSLAQLEQHFHSRNGTNHPYPHQSGGLAKTSPLAGLQFVALETQNREGKLDFQRREKTDIMIVSRDLNRSTMVHQLIPSEKESHRMK